MPVSTRLLASQLYRILSRKCGEHSSQGSTICPIVKMFYYLLTKSKFDGAFHSFCIQLMEVGCVYDTNLADGDRVPIVRALKRTYEEFRFKCHDLEPRSGIRTAVLVSGCIGCFDENAWYELGTTILRDVAVHGIPSVTESNQIWTNGMPRPKKVSIKGPDLSGRFD